MSSDNTRSPPLRAHSSSRVSVWPGIIVGASLGAVVGSSSLLIRTDPAPTAAVNAPIPASTSSGGVESEADYLARATALVPNAPAEALALAEGHAERFPNSKMGQEREFLAISALSALGRKAEAHARAKLFLTLFPESKMRPQVESLLPDVAPPK